MNIKKGNIYYYLNKGEYGIKCIILKALKDYDDFIDGTGLMTIWKVLYEINSGIAVDRVIYGNQLPGVSISGLSNYLYKDEKEIMKKIFN